MSRSYWTVYVEESAGTWLADGQIPRPNADFIYDYTSTQSSYQLADGSRAFITPETTYGKGPVSFVWYLDDDGSIKTKIENYLTNNEYLKIVTHTGTELIGRFINFKITHLLGLDDTYDIEASFDRMA